MPQVSQKTLLQKEFASVEAEYNKLNKYDSELTDKEKLRRKQLRRTLRDLSSKLGKMKPNDQRFP